MQEIKNKEIESVLNAFGDKINNEQIATFKAFCSMNPDVKINAENMKDIEYFYYAIRGNFEKIQKGAIKTMVKDCRKVTWIYLNYYFLNNLFKAQIQKYEGSACSADKSRYIINSIVKFLLNGTKIMENPRQEKEYYRTHFIFDNHDWVINFFEAAHRLYMGIPDDYIEQIAYIINTVPLLKERHQRKNK